MSQTSSETKSRK